MKFPALIIALIFAATPVLAAKPDSILGIWKTEETKSKVELFKCGEKYCGKIIWLKEPLYTDSKKGPVGTRKTDRENSDKTKQAVPILGLEIMKNFVADGENEWSGGTIYDPECGSTYKCKMTLTDPGHLDVRGYIGIPLFGRTTAWTR